MEIECVTSKWHFGTNGGNGRTLNPAFGRGSGRSKRCIPNLSTRSTDRS